MGLARQTARLARAARVAPRVAPRRSVNLSALEAKVTSDEGKQELNRLKMALNEAELLKQKYSSAPAVIDFAAYKGKVDASLLAKAEYDAMFAEAQTKIAESKTRIDELTKQMNVMVAKKVGHATTVDDVYEAYPDIEKEVDDEIDKHEWAKDAV